jgi:hypothetical protein
MTLVRPPDRAGLCGSGDPGRSELIPQAAAQA